METATLRDLRRLSTAVVLCVGAGGVGGIATARSVKTWYPTLKKPPFNPPSGIFGPVWTLLYLMMSVSLWLTWRKKSEDAQIDPALRLFALQLILNVLWSFIFFRLRSPRGAFVEIVILWVAIVLTIRAMAQVSRVAALLMLPYLLWVSFASVLNLAIWRLNAQ